MESLSSTFFSKKNLKAKEKLTKNRGNILRFHSRSFREDWTPISLVIERVENSNSIDLTENSFEFALNENVIKSEKRFVRFRPRNETIGSLKFGSSFVKMNFVMIFLFILRNGLIIFTDVSAFLLVELLFFRPNCDQSSARRFQNSQNFS